MTASSFGQNFVNTTANPNVARKINIIIRIFNAAFQGVPESALDMIQGWPRYPQKLNR